MPSLAVVLGLGISLVTIGCAGSAADSGPSGNTSTELSQHACVVTTPDTGTAEVLLPQSNDPKLQPDKLAKPTPPDAETCEKLNAKLDKLWAAAIDSNKRAPLNRSYSDNRFLLQDRSQRLAEYGVRDAITVKFDSSGACQAEVVTSPAGMVVAEQVHQCKLALLNSLFQIERFMQDEQWNALTEDERALVTAWAKLDRKDRDKLAKQYRRIERLSKRDGTLEIEKLTAELKTDPTKVDLIVKRAKLYAQHDMFDYLSWTDAARAIAIQPKHQGVEETIALEKEQRRKTSGE